MSTFTLDILAISTVISSILVISSPSPIIAVLFLIATFVLAACYLIMLGITYVGLTYLVVYVGAVAVLFLFVVMMLNVQLNQIISTGSEFTKGLPLGAVFSVVFLLEALSVLPTVSTHAGQMFVGILNNIHSFLFGLNESSTSLTNVNLQFATNSMDSTFNYVSQVESLGIGFYSYGAFWLILISFILLVAMMGPIVLAGRTR